MLGRRGFLRSIVAGVALAAGASTGLLPRKGSVQAAGPAPEPSAFANECHDGLFVDYDKPAVAPRYYFIHPSYLHLIAYHIESRRVAVLVPDPR